MTVERLTEVQSQDVNAINSLLRQLVHDPASYKPIDEATMREIVGDPKVSVAVAREEGVLVGMGILYRFNKPRGKYASLEDMMVDEAHRRKGIGEAIARRLIEEARKHGVETIELSARPSRVPANALYQKLGFEQKETNVYRLKL